VILTTRLICHNVTRLLAKLAIIENKKTSQYENWEANFKVND